MTNVWVISVVLNDLVGLRRTAASVLGQSWEATNWLIADGGSTDGTAQLGTEIARVLPNAHFLPGPDGGIYHGMNRALQAVPPDSFVWFLNSGDVFLSETSISSAIQETRAGGWSGGPMLLLGESGQLHRITSVPDLSRFRGRPGVHLPAQPTILASKSLYDELGPFREDLRFASDGVFYQNLARIEAPTIRDEPCVGFLLGGRSSRHFRATLGEYWSAGFRPTSFIARLMDRDVGQARTWLRAGITHLPNWLPSGSRRGRGGVGNTFAHWSHHPQSLSDLRCCIDMGDSLEFRVD